MLSSSLVLIHGYTLAAIEGSSDEFGVRAWDHVVIGDLHTDSPGRLPVGVAIALQTHAKKIVLGSGGTAIYKGRPISRQEWHNKAKPDEVLWESEYTLAFLRQQLPYLCRFSILKNAVDDFGGIRKANNHIRNIAHADSTSSDSSEEVANAIQEAGHLNLASFISVSSPSHEPRCVAYANREIIKANNSVKYVVSVQSRTDFSQACETIIFEPNSGPVRNTDLATCEVLSKYFLLPQADRRHFLQIADNFFEDTIGRSREEP